MLIILRLLAFEDFMVSVHENDAWLKDSRDTTDYEWVKERKSYEVWLLQYIK